MSTKENGKFAGKSMVMGLVLAVVAAFIVSLFVENDAAIWAWAIPSGLGIGLMAGSLPVMTKGIWQSLSLSGYLLMFVVIASVDYLLGEDPWREFAGIIVTLVVITIGMGIVMHSRNKMVVSLPAADETTLS